jgi:hypothetical protein
MHSLPVHQIEAKPNLIVCGFTSSISIHADELENVFNILDLPVADRHHC